MWPRAETHNVYLTSAEYNYILKEIKMKIKSLILMAIIVLFSNFAMADEETDRATANVNIPDRGSASSGIGFNPNDFPSDVTISSIDVSYDIVHTYSSDLIVSIEHPDGTEYTLMNRQGGGSDNPSDTMNDIDVFNGKFPGGLWRLNVSDNAGGDTGYIDEFEVTIHYTTNSTEVVEPIPSSNRITEWNTGEYGHNQDIRKTLHIPGASSLTVTVVGNTERNYDFFYIYNENGDEEKKLHGAILETFTVVGSSIEARLKTDSSVSASGVSISISDDGGSNEFDPNIIPQLRATDFVNIINSASCGANGYARLDFAMPSNQIGFFDYLKVTITGPNNTKMILTPIPTVYGDVWELVQGESLSLIVDGIAKEMPLVGWAYKAYDVGKQIFEIYEEHSDQNITGFSLENDVVGAMYSNQSYYAHFFSDQPVNNWGINIAVEYHSPDYGTTTPNQVLFETVPLCGCN